ERYKVYGIEPKGQYDYVYWRNDHPIDLFMSQIEINLAKKYAEYFGLDKVASRPMERHTVGSRLPLFQEVKFKKQISTVVSMKGFDHVVIGTVWEFEFDTCANMDMIRFALDSGLGERNSLGFGFMNVH
ncbi:MAG: hypothetical protein HRF40_09535, partial [Nitrososphaera sp.]